MKPRFPLLLLIAILALAMALGACSTDDESIVGPEAATITPLSADYFPLAAGNWWSFVRMESGIFSPDSTVDYYDQGLPGAHPRWECEAGTSSDLVLRGSSTSQADGAGELEHFLEIWIDQAGSGFDLRGQDDAGATDSSYVYVDGAPYPWIRFGQLRWEQQLAEYSGDSLEVDYLGDQHGMILLNEAVGFDFDRLIYDGSSQPGSNPWDPSDVDYDTYLDGIRNVRFVGEVIGDEDFAYAGLGALADSLFPQLIGISYEDCRWVRFSLEADIFLSNQRDPNTEPGQPAIPDEYTLNRALERVARRDLGMLLLARDVGPVVALTYTDLDKQIQSGDLTLTEAVFQTDLSQFDILVDSNLTP
jgi:hypothetical protein